MIRKSLKQLTVSNQRHSKRIDIDNLIDNDLYIVVNAIKYSQ